MAQVELLQSLAERHPARVNELADRLRLAQSTVSGLIGQMLRSGLVERHVDPDDRRAAVLSASPTGQARLAEWEAAHLRRFGAALAELDGPDRALVASALPALRRLTALLGSEAIDRT